MVRGAYSSIPCSFSITVEGSSLLLYRSPLVKSVLIYGAPKSGKTMLAHSIAHLSGANLFNISPRNTDGKYPGKQVAMMIHMVWDCELF